MGLGTPERVLLSYLWKASLMSDPIYDMIANMVQNAKSLDRGLNLYFGGLADLVNAWRLQFQNATQKTPGSVDWASINRILSSMEDFELSMKREALKH